MTLEQPNKPWTTRTIVAGCVTLLVALSMLRWNPRVGCGPRLWSSPILVFEFLRSRADVSALFGSSGSCQEQLIQQFTALNQIDYLFMPAYGSLLVCGVMAMHQHFGINDNHWIRRIGLSASVLAPLSDSVENYYLLQFSPNNLTFPLWSMQFFVAAKFSLLAIVSTLLGRWQSQSNKTGWRFSALLHFLALPIVVLSVISPHRFLMYLQLPFLLSWVTLLVWAIAHRNTLKHQVS